MSLNEIPELRSLVRPAASVRIPAELNVPLTDRIRKLIETSAFQRLRRISQLGFVSLVYPGATHSRFEHSLGAYRLALLFLARLAADEAFAASVTPREGLAGLVAALLHDLGHWPYCHPLEDLGLSDFPPHEDLAERILLTKEFRTVLQQEFQLEPEDVSSLIAGRPRTAGERLVGSMLSSPIDVDKMDYLVRDSLHAGVPYGRNFDGQRIIDCLGVGRDGQSLAIGDKGRTAAEMMVFARYIMFSEVYWHHAVRAATAMFQRAFVELRPRLDLAELQGSDDRQFLATFARAAAGQPAARLTCGLWGDSRQLYKRWLEFDAREHPELFRQFARRPYLELCAASAELTRGLERELGWQLDPLSILIDAPPPHLEIQFHLEVRHPRRAEFRRLDELSPVVEALATKQFDDLVKRVRIFVAPDLAERVAPIEHPAAWVASHCRFGAKSTASPAKSG